MQVRKNPAAYGIPGIRLSVSDVERVLKDQLILSNVKELAKHGMVRRLPEMYAACNSIDTFAQDAHSLLGEYLVIIASYHIIIA